jgi:integrase
MRYLPHTRSPVDHFRLWQGRPLGSGSADSAHHRWQGYCSQAGADLGIHQLRHAHGTELINSGVSIEAVRRRLGHASTETTQLYCVSRKLHQTGEGTADLRQLAA